ncbi:MAG: hypothetical protein MUE57_04280, partial [Syntrophales bacterium]|nr:hypothetical protein [Syntrophales bacterium]MCU0583041.1 hypothetical protein [Syntrophales bacterium]
MRALQFCETIKYADEIVKAACAAEGRRGDGASKGWKNSGGCVTESILASGPGHGSGDIISRRGFMKYREIKAKDLKPKTFIDEKVREIREIAG